MTPWITCNIFFCFVHRICLRNIHLNKKKNHVCFCNVTAKFVFWLYLQVSASRNFWPSIVIDQNSGSLEPVEMLTAPYSDAGAFTSLWNRSEMSMNCHFLAVKNPQAQYRILKWAMNFSENVFSTAQISSFLRESSIVLWWPEEWSLDSQYF